ncbi:type I-F CRISPR-associated endoribonuclease Cas6/Csy4 [Marinomonas sp. 2405UD68-3]|uniref:type I-F CRISPR-associated endoribonuclease Cas6/Csy4 n=1 Tax=Marinomonas sp. 2405UD68-3 TaxID=3391835 RepID=UPI0039C8F15B
MKYYLDITLLPDAETNIGFVWHKLYQQIHLMLVENKIGAKDSKDSAVGVSFPLYRRGGFPLGNKLRLLAETQQQLKDLNVEHWLSRLEDYTHIKGIKSVPENVKEYVYFKRWTYKSPDKLRAQVDQQAKHLADKNNVDIESVKQRLLESIDNLDQESKLPFINMTSLSTNGEVPLSERRNFKLFIEKENVKNAEKVQLNQSLFTCYGLSRRTNLEKTAVPWFE